MKAGFPESFKQDNLSILEVSPDNKVGQTTFVNSISNIVNPLSSPTTKYLSPFKNSKALGLKSPIRSRFISLNSY